MKTALYTQKPEKYHHLLYIIAIINVILLSMGMITYNEAFFFWDYPLCDLGNIYTANGFYNSPGIYFFDIAMFLSAALIVILGRSFWRSKTISHKLVTAIICYLGALGFMGTTIPYELWPILHQVGAGIMVASLWALAMVLMLEIKTKISRTLFWSGQIVLQIPLISYGILYFSRSPLRQISQKFGFLGLFLVLLSASTLHYELCSAEEIEECPITDPRTN